MSRQVLMILGLLGSAAAGFGAFRGHDGRRGAAPRDFGRVRQELGLSETQVDQLQKMHLERGKTRIRRRADMAIARMELRSLLRAPTVDDRAVSAKVKELGDLQAAALRDRVDAQLGMRKILTPEQQQKLRDLRPLRPRGGRDGAGSDGVRRGPRRGDQDRPDASLDESPDQGPDEGPGAPSALTAAEGE